jgi:hypothetical protein
LFPGGKHRERECQNKKSHREINGSSLKDIRGLSADQLSHRCITKGGTESLLARALHENEEYEECANAYSYPVPPGDDSYRAFHLADAVLKFTPHRRHDSNDTYAESVLQSNKAYFYGKVALADGTEGFRKIIVNGGSRTSSMESFATRRTDEGCYAITINMHGVTLYRPGKVKERRAAKGVKFGKLLYDLYKELKLDDKPLFIIGRRKVDRGLGFHWAPRDRSEGLVWTDMILGRVDDKNIAVQKAGRLAGIVAQCPQYPGQLTWWTDERTADSILHHNTIVDLANVKRGHTALQARERAKEDSQAAAGGGPEHAVHESISHLEEFSSMETLRARWHDILGEVEQAYRAPQTPRQRDGAYVCSIGEDSKKQTARDIRDAVGGTSTAYWGSGLTGAANGQRIHRVYVGYEESGEVKFFLRWTQKV